jgi:CheY-like chemotaxis protein
MNRVMASPDEFYDIVFMDIQMPDMDGVETTQKLRDKYGKGSVDNPFPPVVAMTAYSMKEDRERFLSQGMDDYVAKPIRAHTLIAKVQEIIGQSPDRPMTDKQLALAKEIALPVLDREIVNQLKQIGGKELVLSVYEDFVNESNELIGEALIAFKADDIATIERQRGHRGRDAGRRNRPRSRGAAQDRRCQHPCQILAGVAVGLREIFGEL